MKTTLGILFVWKGGNTMNEKDTVFKKAIDNEVPSIIALVNEFSKNNHGTITKTRDGKKQFVDLVEASGQACCIDEFKLYIKYKGSKDGTRSLWGGLADPLIVQIDELIKIANKIEDNNENVKLEVLKRFCGYLMWRTHADISGQGGR